MGVLVSFHGYFGYLNSVVNVGRLRVKPQLKDENGVVEE